MIRMFKMSRLKKLKSKPKSLMLEENLLPLMLMMKAQILAKMTRIMNLIISLIEKLLEFKKSHTLRKKEMESQ
jgi:hypothetical protein